MPETLSKHVFLFPFRWDIKCSEKSFSEIDYDDRTNFSQFCKTLLSGNNLWREDNQFVPLKDALDYNARSYFYPFTRNALFPASHNDDTRLARFFSYEIGNDATYKIALRSNPSQSQVDNLPYKLLIKSINLNIYDAGIGLLTYHLETQGKVRPDDILNINDFGRRLFPAYLGHGFDIEPPKGSFLADTITLSNTTQSTSFNPSIENNNPTITYKTDPDYLPYHVLGILGPSFKLAQNYELGQIKIEPVLDDRMYVLSWYANDSLSGRLSQFRKSVNQYNLNTERNFWYRYIFVDNKDLTCPDPVLRDALLAQATYTRWSPSGTFFGVSRYAFVMTTNEQWLPVNILSVHLTNLYTRMAGLALIQRAALLRFSGEVSNISRDLRSEKADVSGISEQVQKLYRHYIQFNNKFYFREVTAQEQGIELYDMIQKAMCIHTMAEDVEQEIEQLDSYLQVASNENERRSIERLSLLGGLFLIPGFILSYLSLGIVEFDKWHIGSIGFSLVGISFLLMTVLIIYAYYLPKNRSYSFTSKYFLEKKVKWSIPVIIATIIGALLAIPFWKAIKEQKEKIEPVVVTDSLTYHKIDTLQQQIQRLRALAPRDK